VTNLTESLPKTGSLFKRVKTKALDAIHTFSFTEKIVFYSLLGLFAGSSIFLLSKVNEYFTVEVPVAGGVIKEGIVGYPRYINPLLSVTDAGKDLSLLVYSGLLKATPEGDLVSDLAETYTISEDKLEYTVTLRDDVYFHDGEPVTTKDVEFTIKKSLDPILKSPKAPNWQGVSLEVVDEKNIKFHLQQPYGPFLENLTLGILPEHIWKNIESEAFLFSQYNFEPIGSGPFKVEEVKQDKSGLPLYYRFSPFKKYALGKPYIKELYIYFFSNEDKMLNAYENGDIDQMNSISSEKIKRLIVEDNISVKRAPLPRIFGLFLNQNESPVFANKEVRQALNDSIDRNKIIESVLQGFGTEATSPLPSFIRKSPTGETSVSEDKLPGAIALLEKSGWKKNTEGVYEKKDKKGSSTLSFSISTSNVPELKATAYLLKETWEMLGAKVEVKVFDLADLNQNIIRQRKYDSLLFGEAIGRDLDLFAFWHSSERNDPGLNVSMYTNSKVDKILEDARKTEDPEERFELYKTFENEIENDVPAIFIYSPDFVYITNPDVEGIDIEGIANPSERFLGINEWYTDTQRIWTFFDKK